MTARMCASLRNTKGMLKTLTSGTTGPAGPSEVRRIWMALTWVCSIIVFSEPSTLFGNICILYLPLVAASNFLPRFSMAATVG